MTTMMIACYVYNPLDSSFTTAFIRNDTASHDKRDEKERIIVFALVFQ